MMASSSAGQPADLLCSAAEIIVIDDEEIGHHVTRSDIYGEGAEPPPETDLSPNDGPLWQWNDGDPVHWHWLESSVKPNYTKLSWQAERVWTKDKEHEAGWNFRAAFGILKWEPAKAPQYAVVVKMALADSDKRTKILMLLVEPGGTDGWDTFVIKTLRRCVYKEPYRCRMVDTEFPLFNNMEKLRHVVRALLAWMQLQPVRLSNICCGRWQDLRPRQPGSNEHRETC